MIDNKFTFKDYQTLLVVRKNLIQMRQQKIIDVSYQNALQIETRLQAKLDDKGITPELEEIIDFAVVVQKSQKLMGEKIQAYALKYDGKPEFEKGGEIIESEPKIIKQ